ncbi:hypothetical protein AYO44_06370 [Planctomycetaceae bacterium SCGC AG-212-F19]|nr:hypothetical protein AYO44_06370 [Planctomycetaceae bacterium SCGC AG-212-F19]
MATANPAMNPAVYERAGLAESPAAVMTVQGAALKTAVLLGILLLTGVFTWTQAMNGETGLANGLMALGGIGGFIVALVTVFFPKAAPITAPIYAALEGLLLGGVSASFETVYSGIVIQAVSLSVGILAVMLTIYATGIIKATENFKIGVAAATGGICLVYLADLILSWFGIRVPFIHEGGIVGIGFSLLVVGIAALNFILDFDFIEKGVEQGAPKYMEWYGGFSLLVTLIWMYLEILRLLAKISGGSRQ